MEIGSAKWKAVIIDGAKTLGIHIDQKTADLFAIHGMELIRWSKKTNLTAIIDPMEVAVKHFIDSIAPANYIPSGSKLLDVGSGGGFPGLPLKITVPTLWVTLIDGSRKKVSFMHHVIQMLGFSNIGVMQVRVEDLAKQMAFSGAFDIIICRAFSNLSLFVQQTLPLLANGGKWIALRGNLTEKDTQLLKKFSLPYTIHEYHLPYINARRSLVILG